MDFLRFASIKKFQIHVQFNKKSKEFDTRIAKEN